MSKLNLKIIFSLLVLIAILFSGSYFYHIAENWSYINSLYFSVMTLTTIGYGDLLPTTDVSKLFTVFYSIFGIGAMIYFMSAIIAKYIFNQEKYFTKIVNKIKDYRIKKNKK